MNYVKKLNLHWFCTQNHILEPFSVRRACTKSYVTSEPYPRASQIWCQNVREIWKKKVIKCRGESFARCRVIARNVEGGGLLGPPPPPVFLGLKPWYFISKVKYCAYMSETANVMFGGPVTVKMPISNCSHNWTSIENMLLGLRYEYNSSLTIKSGIVKLLSYWLKVIWSFGKGSEIFRENSHLFDFHLKAYYVCIVTWKSKTWNVLRPKRNLLLFPLTRPTRQKAADSVNFMAFKKKKNNNNCQSFVNMWLSLIWFNKTYK